VKQRLSLCTYGCMQNISIGYKLYIRHLFLKYRVRISYYNLFSSIHVLLILSTPFKKFYVENRDLQFVPTLTHLDFIL